MTSQTVKKLRIYTVISAIITCVLGVLGHFAYDFFQQNQFVALFFPVNESTWEHIKLLYFPMVFCLLISCFMLGSNRSQSYQDGPKANHKICSCCYLLGILMGTITGIFVIPILFYTISGIIGRVVDWLNIVIYFISVIFAYYVFYQYATLPYSNTFIYHNRKNNNSLINTKSDNHCKNVPSWLSIAGLILIAILFFVFTFYTPKIGLFYDPVTHTYGI